MKKRFFALFAIAVLVFFMIGCGGSESAEAPQASSEQATESVVLDGGGADVRIFVTFRGQRFPSYNESTPWEAPNGKTYNKGDLSPTYSHIAEALNINIIDATPKSGSNENELLEAAAATGFKSSDIYMGHPRTLCDYGVQGYFVPLNEHWDLMPNFKAFLDKNPSVKMQLTQQDGNIYMTPYFDDINSLERMFLMRLDWVRKILDEPSPAFNTGRTITPVYDSFYGNYGGGKKVPVGSKDNVKSFAIKENIIDIQNKLGTLNGRTLAQSLRDYIDAHYMNDKTGYKNRSDLFISSDAAYDADELVALMRAIKTNPQYLTGEDKDLIVFYIRDLNNDMRMRNLAQIWGVRGLDSRADHWLITKENTLKDLRLTDEYYMGMDNLNKLYREGLVLQDFDQPKGNINNFRTYCFQNNDGFMSYDYAASTVSLHDLIPPEQLAEYGTIFEAVVPPAADWFGEGLEQFSESNRSVKNEGGWSAVKDVSPETMKAALLLMDYPFSKEGLEVMTFGPKGLYWNEYTSIGGQQVPKLIPQFYEDNLQYTQGNWSNFMRGFLGATLGIGHVKQTIAIETQISNEHYANGHNRILNSPMTLASLTSDVPPERRLALTIIPLSEDQVESLSLNSYSLYHEEWENRIMKFGFGGELPGGEGRVPTAEEYRAEMVNRGLEQTEKIYNLVYKSLAD